MSSQGPVFGIVAGEASGDTLGADLIRALKIQHPKAKFIGIAGPQMLAEGAETLVPMERLSVMGLVEVLGRLCELLALRDQLIAHLLEQKIDVFIGIDAPDFNLRIAAELKAKGLRTVHYVSPSVWAWRQGRVHGIRASVDLMLCLLPFEKAFYDQHDVAAVFVGHPLADALPHLNDTLAAQQRLGLTPAPYVALLPGSRRGEVASLLPVLLDAAQRIYSQRPDCVFLIPAINAERRSDIDALVANYAQLPIRVFDQSLGAGVGREVMSAAAVIALASGTATLEALLLKKPMVVTYRLHWLTWLIARFLVRIPFVSLPNLLAARRLVPELLQGQANPHNVSQEVLAWLNDPQRVAVTVASFDDFHTQLARNASVTGAQAISQLLAKPVRVP